MIHVPGWTETKGKRFHHATQNGYAAKIYELFISGNFHLILLDYGQLKTGKDTIGKRGL